MNKAAKKAKVAKVMKEFKAGTLNSGSSKGPSQGKEASNCYCTISGEDDQEEDG
jgi:hypothetical protein